MKSRRYDDVAPFYDRIEQIIGICGEDDHLEVVPAGKHYLSPLPWRCSERLLFKATKEMGIPLISVRKAVLTRPYDGRPPRHYCGRCMEGCDASSIFTTPNCMLPKARATGNFTLRQNAIAREILSDQSGRARAVCFMAVPDLEWVPPIGSVLDEAEFLRFLRHGEIYRNDGGTGAAW